jgi:hypothetical protein
MERDVLCTRQNALTYFFLEYISVARVDTLSVARQSGWPQLYLIRFAAKVSYFIDFVASRFLSLPSQRLAYGLLRWSW